MKREANLAGLFLAGIVILAFLAFSYVYGQSTDLTSTPLSNAREYLRLTTEQSKAIQDLQDKFLKETESTQNVLSSNCIELRTMLNQKIPDETAILAKHNEITSIVHKLQEKALQYGLEVEAILTPEQIALIPPGHLPRFFLGRRRGLGFGRGFGLGFGRGYGSVSSRGYGYGMGRGFGRGMGRGLGRGVGRGFGRAW